MTEEARLWDKLDAAIDRLADRGCAGFWLRDDDAVAPSARLDRLIALAEEAGIPLALAVIPASAEPALPERLAREAHVTVLQHGYAHANHAPAGAKKCEVGDDRPIETVLAGLREGRARLRAFPSFQPMFVPPWNRIGAKVAARLPELGFEALSLYGPRDAFCDTAGLRRFNTHLDPVDWRGTRGFVGRADMLVMLLKRLHAMASGEEDAAEPTGVLTHHLVHDEETFAFLADLFQAISNHSKARWHSVETLLGLKVPIHGGDAP